MNITKLTRKQAAYTLTHMQNETHTILYTCTHTFVFMEPVLMMGGSMMFVCVPKELALLLGPNQQPTAAGY